MARKEYSIELVQTRTGRDVPDLLRELYVERRYSQQEIADALGVTRSLLQVWLKRYDISREDRLPLVVA